MENTEMTKLARTRKGRTELAVAALELDVQENVAKILEQTGMSYKQLDRKLGKQKGYTKRFLNGCERKSLRAVAQVFLALGFELRVSPKAPLWSEEAKENRKKPVATMRAAKS